MAQYSDQPKNDSLDGVFEVICRHKEADTPSNLNQIFESYGTNILEHKVPIIDLDVSERLTGVSDEQKQYATMAFKTLSGQDALEGRLGRTKNRELRLVDIGGETVIAAGKIRDRSPVDVKVLDLDLDRYRQKTAKLRANRSGRTTPERLSSSPFARPPVVQPKVEVKQEPMDWDSPVPKPTFRVPLKNRQEVKKEVPTRVEMDSDLDEYMSVARRKKNQKSDLFEQVERAKTMEEMEEMMNEDLQNRLNDLDGF